MKKYRLGYDKVFLPHPKIKIKNEIIRGLSIYIKYKLFDTKTGLEITFNIKDQSIGVGVKEYFLNDFLICSFDKNYESYIKIEEIRKEKLEQWGYRLEYEISSYSKDVVCDERGNCEPKDITKEEFYKILSENIKNFDNTDNVNAQSCSFVTYEIKD